MQWLSRLSPDRGCIMASWGSFAWGFFVGLFIGQVTLVFFLALVRQGNTEQVSEYSPPIAAEHDMLAPSASRTRASSKVTVPAP
jgi:hypothetical protein